MTMSEIKKPVISEMRPKITVIGVGGGGGNAINNMIAEGLQGADFVAANTDAQALTMSKAPRLIQLGAQVTEGLGAGSLPEVGRAAAEESIDEIMDHLGGTHMCFVTAGMGGGTGTGAAPVIAAAARKAGILTVGVVTKPFSFEGKRRMQAAEEGIERLREAADTVIVIPNQNLFRIADAKTTFADAFIIADRVLYSGVGCITDLIVKEGLINLDFADVKSAEAAIANPLLSEVSMKGAKGVLISISGGSDMTLFEVDEAATRIREEVCEDADIVVGAIFDKGLDGVFRVSVVATGLDSQALTTGDVAGVAAQPPQARTLQ
jgi:cell division protein FtsZ